VRDYGKVHTSFWTSPNIRELSDDGRTLALYLLTCQHGTIAGVFRLPDGYASEDLQWSSERVKTTLAELFNNGFATRCETTKWVWVIKHLEWNPPENPNQRKAVAKMVTQVPDSCEWKDRFIGENSDLIGIHKEKISPESEPLANPLETLSKPVTVTVTVEERDKSLSSTSALPKLPDCPHLEILELFGKHLPTLAQPRPESWDGKRAENLRARWRWVLTKTRKNGERYAEDKAQGLAWFDRFFSYVADSDFLMGRAGNFTATIDWLVNQTNFAKVLDGNYENRAEVAA